MPWNRPLKPLSPPAWTRSTRSIQSGWEKLRVYEIGMASSLGRTGRGQAREAVRREGVGGGEVGVGGAELDDVGAQPVGADLDTDRVEPVEDVHHEVVLVLGQRHGRIRVERGTSRTSNWYGSKWSPRTETIRTSVLPGCAR